jgi:hypothetical protein
MMLPTFTQSVFQGILNKKLSTPEDLKDDWKDWKRFSR